MDIGAHRLAVLPALVAHWPDDPRWLLARASAEEVTDLARGMRVSVASTNDPKSPILHSRLLFLVEGRGDVRAVYDSDDALAWRRLALDAEDLVSDAAPGALERRPGVDAPLARAGCNGCRDRPELAPRLDGARDRAVTLASGERVMADDAYLRESILKPSSKPVAGYARLMPSYEGLLRQDEIDALLAAIRALPHAEPDPQVLAPVAPAPSGDPAEDPVCHVEVATTDPSLSVTRDGHTFRLCSQTCRDRFRGVRE